MCFTINASSSQTGALYSCNLEVELNQTYLHLQKNIRSKIGSLKEPKKNLKLWFSKHFDLPSEAGRLGYFIHEQRISDRAVSRNSIQCMV